MKILTGHIILTVFIFSAAASVLAADAEFYDKNLED